MTIKEASLEALTEIVGQHKASILRDYFENNQPK